jgi:hypothetical protein
MAAGEGTGSACSVCLKPGRCSDMRSHERAGTGELPIRSGYNVLRNVQF